MVFKEYRNPKCDYNSEEDYGILIFYFFKKNKIK